MNDTKIDDQPLGTFACPICGHDKPHTHTDAEQAAYRDDQIRNDDWTSTVKRNPKTTGWYLCMGVDFPSKAPEGGETWPGSRSSQLAWLRWVRDAAARGDEVPEVLHFDARARQWSLRIMLGNAVPSGVDCRWRVQATPRFWREVPPLAPNAELSRPAAGANEMIRDREAGSA